MTWSSATLGSLTNDGKGLIQTGPFGSQLHEHEYESEGIPVIMPKDILDGRVDTGSVARVSESTAMRLERHRLRPRTIVLPRRGAITKRALIREEEEGWLCGTGCLQIVLDRSLVLPEFLYYYLEQEQSAQWLEQHAVGTTMLNLSATIVSEFPVRFPSRGVQERIAEILSAYDDLIENNRGRMGLLDDAARQLYQEWFVRLRFPGREHTQVVDGVPKGWRRGVLQDLVYLQRGFDITQAQQRPGGVPVISSSGVTSFHDEAKVQGPGVVIGRKGTLGSVHYARCDYWPHDTTLWSKDLRGNSARFVYQYLRTIDVKRFDVGNSNPTLNRNHIHDLPALLPPMSIRTAFDQFAAPAFEQRENLVRQNDKLRAARDLLLPRLMSGKVTA